MENGNANVKAPLNVYNLTLQLFLHFKWIFTFHYSISFYFCYLLMVFFKTLLIQSIYWCITISSVSSVYIYKLLFLLLFKYQKQVTTEGLGQQAVQVLQENHNMWQQRVGFKAAPHPVYFWTGKSFLNSKNWTSSQSICTFNCLHK